MFSGFYVYCRIWHGFTEHFPHFDELNSFPDDKIVLEIETRALNWLRSNNPTVRKRYQAERAGIQEVRSKPRPGEAVHAGLSPLAIKLDERLNALQSEELTQLAEKLQLEPQGSETLIRMALLQVLYPRLCRKESRDATIAILPLSFGTCFPVPERLATTVKRNIRGEHSDPLPIRIMRYARWMDSTKDRLGGLTPSDKLYLGRLPNEDLLMPGLVSGMMLYAKARR